MQLVVLVLNKTECLEELLEKFVEINVKGATIIESSGMAKALYNDSHVSDLFGSLRALINPRKESKTIFCVVKDEIVQDVRDAVEEVTGGLDNPDTGILFSVPTLFVDGIHPGRAARK